jgi:hypothetical protein
MATRCLGLATLVLTASILVLEISAQIECGGNVTGIITQCKSFVSKDGPKIPPSKPCCDALKGANVSCYCKYVTPGIENMISIEKALYVAKTCQCQNIPTDKCGSKLISILFVIQFFFWKNGLISICTILILFCINVTFSGYIIPHPAPPKA